MFERQLARLRSLLNCAICPGSNSITKQVEAELDAYFSGTFQGFTVPLSAPGTSFQKIVWDQLQTISYGHTTTYGDLAEAVGRPTAVRAVAQANGANRIAVIIPCHRVIGKGGKMTGYGGGVWRKQRLLDHEQAHKGHSTCAENHAPLNANGAR